jgi:hypothetical protein
MMRVGAMLQRRCACGGTPGPDGECADCKRRRLQRHATGAGPGRAPPIVHDVLRSPGRPLEPSVRGEMEARFGHDFSRVRVHTNGRAAESARALNANAYTVGRDVVFGEGRYEPASADGTRLLAHELTHVVQQGAVSAPAGPLTIERADSTAEQVALRGEAPREGSVPAVQREPTFPDATCDHVRSNIERAWPTAKSWVSHARRQLTSPTEVAGELGTHFKLDPNDSAQAGDLSYVQDVFARMEAIFDRQVPQVCTPPNVGEECHLPDGREYGAFVTDGVFQITYCTEAADVGLLRGEGLIETVVHEVSHLADVANTDWAYRHKAARTSYGRMTRAQAILNGDSYSEFARDLYAGGPPRRVENILFGAGFGALLSAQQPRWVVRPSLDFRSRTGLEVFDLVGGLHGFFSVSGGDSPDISKQGPAVGVGIDFGVITRSPQTKMFLDTRLGAFMADDPKASGAAAGVSARALIGWASGGFRAGVDLRLLHDLLRDNDAMIIGVELGYEP